MADPNGKTVFVSGGSYGPKTPASSQKYSTIAYSAATGAQLWAVVSGTVGWANAATVSRSGAGVYVTGRT